MKSNFGVITQLYIFLKILPRKYLFFLSISCLIILSILEIFFASVIKDLVEIAINMETGILPNLLIIAVLLSLTRLVLTFINTKTLGKFTENALVYLRSKMLNQLTHLPLQTIAKRHSGDYISRMNTDLNHIRKFIISTSGELISIPLKGICSLLYLCILNWQLTVLSIILFALLILVSTKMSAPISKLSNELQKRNAKISSISKEVLSGKQILKAFCLEKVFIDKFGQAIDDSIMSYKYLAKQQSILETFANFIQIAPYIIIFGIGGYLAIIGEISSGTLMAFIYLIGNLITPLREIPPLIVDVRTSLVSINRIFEIMDLAVERTNGSNFALKKNDVVIEFKNLSFAYDKHLILQNLNFKVQNGDNIAFVGPSGSGKSTIIKLLLGFYENYKGDILFYGRELSEWHLDDLRKNIAFVSQDSYLFADSIKENVAYGKKNSTTQEIIAATKIANAYDFITRLENGFESNVGELGSKLSGGEKQRIALARAILKDAKIIIFDEPTSALDIGSEKIIQETIRTYIKLKTSITIAHRLSTIKNADKIYVLNQGKVVEIGDHEELLKENGLYAKLYSAQADQEKNSILEGIR